MQKSIEKQTKNISKITIALKICNKLIKTLFKIELKYHNFDKCKEVKAYVKDENNDLNYDNSFELNAIINLFLKNKSCSNFISNLEEEEKKLFVDFLNKCRNLKNKLFHEEIYKISEEDLNRNLIVFVNAMQLVNLKYTKFKIIKSKYIEYLNNLIVIK